MQRRLALPRHARGALLASRAKLALLVVASAAFASAAGAGAAIKSAGAVGARAAARTTSPVPGIVDIDTKLGLEQGAAAGTGIVLTSTGEILTNNHVIRGETSVTVRDVDNGRTYKAKVVGYDVAADIAVVQLEQASNLETARIGTAAGAKVGDSVTAYGNAGGVGGAPSTAGGTIVGLGRTITARDDSGDSEQLTGLIETNASLRPGDSGGPIVDGAAGSVIGMDTAASTSFQLEFQSSAPRGYSIPIQRATAIAAQIVAGHSSSTVHVGATGFMGVSVQGRSFFGEQSSSGLTIAAVVPGSPVEKAGLAAGDIVTAFDGRIVDSPSKLTALVITKAPGDTVQIHWIDALGAAHSSTLRLVSGPPQ